MKQALTEKQLTLVYKSVETVLMMTTRKSDVVAKWDEHTFIVVAADRGHKESALVHRIKESVASLSESGVVKIQLIVGAATYPIEGNDFDTLIEIARERLYKAQKEEES